MLTDKLNVQRTEEEHNCIMGASTEGKEVCTFDDLMKTCEEKKRIAIF